MSRITYIILISIAVVLIVSFLVYKSKQKSKIENKQINDCPLPPCNEQNNAQNNAQLSNPANPVQQSNSGVDYGNITATILTGGLNYLAPAVIGAFKNK